MIAGHIVAQLRNRELRSGTQLVLLSVPSGTPALRMMLPMFRLVFMPQPNVDILSDTPTGLILAPVKLTVNKYQTPQSWSTQHSCISLLTRGFPPLVPIISQPLHKAKSTQLSFKSSCGLLLSKHCLKVQVFSALQDNLNSELL